MINVAVGGVIIPACKDPRKTKLKVPAPEWFTLRPWVREPQVVIGFTWRNGIRYAMTRGMVSKRVKPGIAMTRVRSNGWARFSREYEYRPRKHPHVNEIIALFKERK